MQYFLSLLGLPFTYVSPSLQIRCKFDSSPFQEWEENGTYTDFGTDLHGTWKGGVV